MRFLRADELDQPVGACRDVPRDNDLDAEARSVGSLARGLHGAVSVIFAAAANTQKSTCTPLPVRRAWSHAASATVAEMVAALIVAW